MDSTILRLRDCEFPIDFQEAKKLFEKMFVQEVLIHYNGNVSKAARAIRMGRRNLQVKIMKYDIDIDAIRQGRVEQTCPSKEALIDAVKLLNNYVQV